MIFLPLSGHPNPLSGYLYFIHPSVVVVFWEQNLSAAPLILTISLLLITTKPLSYFHFFCS